MLQLLGYVEAKHRRCKSALPKRLSVVYPIPYNRICGMDHGLPSAPNTPEVYVG